jgi:hypothetical protein
MRTACFQPTYLTDVGAYGTDSQNYYGLNDMAGNVWEWNDLFGASGSSRGLRGGSWYDDESLLRSSIGFPVNAANEGDGVFGFRLASIPEPSSTLLTLLFSTGLLCRRKRMPEPLPQPSTTMKHTPLNQTNHEIHHEIAVSSSCSPCLGSSRHARTAPSSTWERNWESSAQGVKDGYPNEGLGRLRPAPNSRGLPEGQHLGAVIGGFDGEISARQMASPSPRSWRSGEAASGENTPACCRLHHSLHALERSHSLTNA